MCLLKPDKTWFLDVFSGATAILSRHRHVALLNRNAIEAFSPRVAESARLPWGPSLNSSTQNGLDQSHTYRSSRDRCNPFWVDHDLIPTRRRPSGSRANAGLNAAIPLE